MAALLGTGTLWSCASDAKDEEEAGEEGSAQTLTVSDPDYYTRFKGKDISINVYNWGEYISTGADEGTLDVNSEFEKLTGIKVNYTNYATNEELYAKLKGGAASRKRPVAASEAAAFVRKGEKVAELAGREGGIGVSFGYSLLLCGRSAAAYRVDGVHRAIVQFPGKRGNFLDVPGPLIRAYACRSAEALGKLPVCRKPLRSVKILLVRAAVTVQFGWRKAEGEDGVGGSHLPHPARTCLKAVKNIHKV